MPSKPLNVWGLTREQAARRRRFWLMMYALGILSGVALGIIIVLAVR